MTARTPSGDNGSRYGDASRPRQHGTATDPLVALCRRPAAGGGKTADPAPGDLAATIIGRAVREGRIELLLPGRVPAVSSHWLGWQAGTDVMLPRRVSTDGMIALALDDPAAFSRSYRALLAEGRLLHARLPIMFVGAGEEPEDPMLAIARLSRQAVIVLPAGRFDLDPRGGTVADFPRVEKTMDSLRRPLECLLGLRGYGPERDLPRWTLLAELEPLVGFRAKHRPRRSA